MYHVNAQRCSQCEPQFPPGTLPHTYGCPSLIISSLGTGCAAPHCPAQGGPGTGSWRWEGEFGNLCCCCCSWSNERSRIWVGGWGPQINPSRTSCGSWATSWAALARVCFCNLGAPGGFLKDELLAFWLNSARPAARVDFIALYCSLPNLLL